VHLHVFLLSGLPRVEVVQRLRVRVACFFAGWPRLLGCSGRSKHKVEFVQKTTHSTSLQDPAGLVSHLLSSASASPVCLLSFYIILDNCWEDRYTTVAIGGHRWAQVDSFFPSLHSSAHSTSPTSTDSANESRCCGTVPLAPSRPRSHQRRQEDLLTFLCTTHHYLTLDIILHLRLGPRDLVVGTRFVWNPAERATVLLIPTAAGDRGV
jgi:hypothetical protein